MSVPAGDGLTDRHLTLFGAIVHAFACHEWEMLKIASAISGAPVFSIKLMTDRLDFSGKREGFINLLRQSNQPVERVDCILRHLVPPQTYARLCNDIVHSSWIPGDPAGLIFPAWLSHGSLKAIKPQQHIGGDERNLVETFEDRRSYTIQDFEDIADLLHKNLIALRSYATSCRLEPA